MNNIFVLYGEEAFLVDKYIKSIVTSKKINTIINYDLSEKQVSLMLEDASMISLFEDSKIIIGYNADFLSGNQKKESIEQDYKCLDKYIDNPNLNSIIIFVTDSDKLDKRKNIVKKLMEKAEVKEFKKLSDYELNNFIKKIFEQDKYHIKEKAIYELIDRVGNNLLALSNEIEKLKLYKLDNKNIELEDVKEMVMKYDFDNIFALSDAVVKKDVGTALNLYKELLKRNEEPIKIIVLLANQFRLIYQSKKLFSKGFSEGQIASDLGVHPYRVKLARESDLKEQELLKYINHLADLDADIKMGKINKNIGLELFLLNL